MRIVLFGGAFDPPTIAHRRMITMALGSIQPDLILVQPTAVPSHKGPVARFEQRCEMAKIAFGNEYHTLLADFESANKVSYTADTVMEIVKKFPKAELWILIGEDEFNNFHKWHQPFTILSYANLLIVHRGNSHQARDQIRNGKFKDQFKFVSISADEVSSSNYREDPKANQAFVDPKVQEYIEEKHLYGA